MKRRLDDTGTPVETVVNTFSSSPHSPTRSRSISSISNLTFSSQPPIINNISNQYPVDSTSPVHSFNSIMPTLTISHDQNSVNAIPVGQPVSLSSSIGHSLSIRNKVHCSSMSSGPCPTSPQQQFQKLKVEDALSYLDQVKFKFGSQPQVYNDFLDIMKEFKSQSIDTPGVITRVSNLFKGHPELIVGFNTFLPPGYKIEVQSSDSGGYSFQVSVSIPSPSSALAQSTQSILHTSTISNITSSPVVTTVNNLMTGSNINLVSSPVVTKPVPVSNSTASPTTTAPSLITSTPVTTTVISNNVTTANSVPSVNSASIPTFLMNPAHQAVSQALIQVESGNTNQPIPPPNQPVEFNHAINYVNKIKNRFQGQPDKYKRFLEILHTYQKEQRTLKENQISCGGSAKTLTEAEVYSQVAKLFENQEDLLAEFGQFLPDATSHQTSSYISKSNDLAFNSTRKPSLTSKNSTNLCNNSAAINTTNTTSNSSCKFSSSSNNVSSTTSAVGSGLLKRTSSMPISNSMQSAVKKHKCPSSSRGDFSVSEAGKYGTLSDFAYFDQIRKTIHNAEMYRNFLRCLVLYNNEIINETELLQLTSPFLTAHPELLRWFKEFLGQSDVPVSAINSNNVKDETTRRTENHHAFLDQVHNSVIRSENNMDIDYTTCKRIGASYCAVPDDFSTPKCSGRTALCREVLNDIWVSFPSWSEDSTFVSSRKTQYEEYIYRCEDERFELDVVIETNAATIKVFDGIQKKINRLSVEEASKLRLDDCLGGTSPSIQLRAIRRIYGDKSGDIIEGLKKNPAAAIPVVLKRLKAKELEWREAQKGFNKIWREQNEKFYLKSLDHQGMNFKQNDMKYLRSKSLRNEIDALYQERNDDTNPNPSSGPHLVLPYRDKSVLDDAANLLIHHVKRQAGIHKDDKQKIKSIIRQFIPDLFGHPRQELSDDEREDSEEPPEKSSPRAEKDDEESGAAGEEPQQPPELGVSLSSFSEPDCGAGEDAKIPMHAMGSEPDERYTLFFADNHWYLFLRLHQILCDRLSRMNERAVILAKHETRSRDGRKESVAISLRLKPKPEVDVEEYYPAMLDMVKNVLDGNMDTNTYEDTLREMFGIHAYLAFTMDKVVTHAVRQLQHLVTDDNSIDCYELYNKEVVRQSTGGLCATAYQRVNPEANYQKKAETLNLDSCFKIFIYKIDCKISIECLDTEGDEEDGQYNEKWDNFQDNETNRDREDGDSRDRREKLDDEYSEINHKDIK